MKNIDKVKQMSPKELVKFMRSLQCDKCIYNNTNCQHDMCTEGMTKWLELEGELTIEEVTDEFYFYCNNKKSNRNLCSTDCYYYRLNKYKHWVNSECYIAYIHKNFNIINGKITRR